MKPLTHDELDSLKALADAATNPPWITQTGVFTGDNWLIAMCGLDTPTNEEVYVTSEFVRSSDLNDGTAKDCGLFIAASRETVPRLIAELERARELLQECADALTHSWEKEGLENLLARLDAGGLGLGLGQAEDGDGVREVKAWREEQQ